MHHKNNCTICGEELQYLDHTIDTSCKYCNTQANTQVICKAGHFVCDKCHASEAMEIIKNTCQNSDEKDPVALSEILFKHPSIKMHGPEHHFLVPAVLLTTYYNITGKHELLNKKLDLGIQRGNMVPGGFCGFHGACGAGIGTGIFFSLITDTTPLSTGSWKFSNMITSRALMKIAEQGGPRCCKRDSYIAIMEAVNFVQEQLNVKIPVMQKISCSYDSYNKECTLKACQFYTLN